MLVCVTELFDKRYVNMDLYTKGISYFCLNIFYHIYLTKYELTINRVSLLFLFSSYFIINLSFHSHHVCPIMYDNKWCEIY